MTEMESQRGRGRRLPEPAMAALVAIVCVALVGLLAVAGGRGSTVRAQVEPEASPVMNPTMGECVVPAGTPMATAEETVEAEGTPAVAPVGTPVEGADADAAIAAAQNLVFCWNAGDLGAVLGLVTPNLLADKFGAASAEEATELLMGMGELPPYTILGIGNVQSWDDGRVSVDLIYLLGEYQYVEARWYMVSAGDQLLIDEEDLMPAVPEGELNVVISFSISANAATGVTADEDPVGFDQSTRVTTADVITLHGRNSGEEQHIFSVVRVSDDATAGTPTAEEFDPTAGAFIGTLSLASREEGDIALVNLPAGVYVLYDPAVEGSVAPLTVSEPEA